MTTTKKNRGRPPTGRTRLQQLLSKQGWTHDAFAQAIHRQIDSRQVRRWATEGKPPKVYLDTIAELLRVPAWTLIPGAVKSSDKPSLDRSRAPQRRDGRTRGGSPRPGSSDEQVVTTRGRPLEYGRTLLGRFMREFHLRDEDFVLFYYLVTKDIIDDELISRYRRGVTVPTGTRAAEFQKLFQMQSQISHRLNLRTPASTKQKSITAAHPRSTSKSKRSMR